MIKTAIKRELWKKALDLKGGEWEFPRSFRFFRRMIHKLIERLS